jgi:RNA polymerase sigma-70 factor (ECF subfamily)
MDAELVALARSGDSRAGDELARRYRRSAYLLALQLLRDPDEAMDVAQDALLRFFSNLDRFDGRRDVAPWLFAIVRNRARDVMRRRRRRPTEPLDSGDEDRPALEVIDHRPGPEACVSRKELQARVWKALSRLPDAQREILVLRDYQDLSYDEISRVLRIPAGTVMSRLHRARKNLRDILEAGGPRA